MRISQKGIDFVKRNEGIKKGTYYDNVYHSYQDIVGVWTIYYGLTYIAGLKVTKSTTLTPQAAEQLFIDELAEYQFEVNDKLNERGITVSQNEYDALVDFCFNVGCRAFRNSYLMNYTDLKDRQAVVKQFNRWVYAKGKVVSGLKNRRDKESNLYAKGDYGN